MTEQVTLPRIGTADAWRDAARRFLAAGVPPEAITWGNTETPPGLFGAPRQTLPTAEVRVPRSFVQMADTVVWHNDPQRFARLYAFLWRLRSAPHLMSDRGDADLSQLRRMEKNVRRCQHKMKAFVRFREIGDPDDARRSFAAWFEPTHHTIEPTAQFFVRRFADMDWRILTPDISVFFENGVLRFCEDQPLPDLPPDASEVLWVTYFRNIFNPARLKVRAMQSEMPKKYWKYMPEAAAIPELIATAPARAREMAENAPTLPPSRLDAIRAQQAAHVSAWSGSAGDLQAAVRSCTRCALHCRATQAVPGEGPEGAHLMIVGEQPGDMEDLQGRPFVGPAGQILDRVLSETGADRSKIYVTNTVKHFSFTSRGRHRIHKRPTSDEVMHCRWWLEAELKLVGPDLIIALGAVASQALTGNGGLMRDRRGRIEPGPDEIPVLTTLHPSYLLRLPDTAERARATRLFKQDLMRAVRITAQAQHAE